MGRVKIPKWLTGLPLAPEYHPTDTEFADPIAYISKIEKDASAFGICKVIPPLPKPSKKYVYSNLNKSIPKSRDLGSEGPNSSDNDSRVGGEERAVFTTIQQELGQDGKRSRPASQKQVWQSGEVYTLEEFEVKAKAFSKSVLGSGKEVGAADVEALFWKAASEKAIYVEYANDVPGSGFGEPEGLLGFFHPRKRRRLFDRCSRGRMYGVGNDGSVVRRRQEKEMESVASTSKSVEGECGSGGSEVGGTAGWKLSNSPWNLQVIARSAGSLTRFMMDNIPGVTSPMVYIGMLFSWFAWHVEDHELHSLNFLHTGASKTWYGVPGDYALAFEEVIRKHAYGGDIDRFAALRLLGEKTTLLSPEVVVASGIPCCRLVQNPGEFVVSFPRAYHVGFSHGFNCGEAANFGTPQWLTVAKEAAVRRAAMDQLPMLSHQQLLYLLTMSFLSRVPESLLPGVRSSRLRNRLREGRELLVKKAFIDDVLKENKLLNALKGQDSALRVVLWDPDSLPSFSRESSSQTGTSSDDILSEDAKVAASPNKIAEKDVDQFMSFKESVSDLYLGSEDLSFDFQVDTGTLPCVACGILGYPLMSVVQPSEKALLEFFPAEHLYVQAAADIPQNHGSSQPVDSANICVSGSSDERLNTFGVERPRVFCLEHAVQIKQLLRPKGGVKVLVVCHSDYRKMKANAVALAEEINISFNYKEVQLESATQEELKLIDVAVDAEQPTDLQEDWTSKLGINLRFSVKAGKGCHSKKIGQALNLEYLLSAVTPVSGISSIKWSGKSRTKREPNHHKLDNSCDNQLHDKDTKLHELNGNKGKEGKVPNHRKRVNPCDDQLHDKDTKLHELNGSKGKEGKVLLQYYRKRYRNR